MGSHTAVGVNKPQPHALGKQTNLTSIVFSENRLETIHSVRFLSCRVSEVRSCLGVAGAQKGS